MKLLDSLKEEYDKEATSVEELVEQLNTEGSLTPKDFLFFVARALDKIDKLLSE